MPTNSIEFISSDADGKSAMVPNFPPASGNSGGIEDTPIVDIGSGSEYVKPSAVNIDGGNRGDSGTTRIDGRTRAGRAARGRTTSSAPSGESPVKPAQKISLETMIGGLHMGIAALCANKDLALDDEECKQYAGAIEELQRQYPSIGIDPKKLAIANAVFVIGGIYGSRILNWKLKRELAGPSEPKKETPAPVVEMKQPQPQRQAPKQAAVPSALWPEPAGSD